MVDTAKYIEKHQKVRVEEYPNKINQYPIVSVCVLTYQHRPYIKQCMNSILMQKTDFDIEILLSDDASEDGAREICEDYAQKYPDKVRLFLHHRENNVLINDLPTGRFIFFYNLSHFRGKYIAILEGDDYWTDPNKLQKQVDILETNEDIVICGHRIINVDEAGQLLTSEICSGAGIPKIFTDRDCIAATPIHPGSWVFRSNLISKLPEKINEFLIDDCLILSFLQNGNGHCLPEYMGAYRIHDQGMWSTKANYSKILYMLGYAFFVDEMFPQKYTPDINEIIRSRKLDFANTVIGSMSLQVLINACREGFKNKFIPNAQMIFVLINTFYVLLKRIVNKCVRFLFN